MTRKEFSALAAGQCPDCDGFVFRDGPRDGLRQNIECVRCGSRFNVARYYRTAADMRDGRKSIVIASRIPSKAAGGSARRQDP